MTIMESLERAIAGLQDRDAVSQGLRKALFPLEAYDAQHGTHLIQTLYIYLQHGGNIAATADTLFLHRNSVVYRLQRIEELSGLHPRTPRVRTLLLASLALADPAFLRQQKTTTERNSYEDERPQ